jgi:hypothetical protein
VSVGDSNVFLGNPVDRDNQSSSLSFAKMPESSFSAVSFSKELTIDQRLSTRAQQQKATYLLIGRVVFSNLPSASKIK